MAVIAVAVGLALVFASGYYLGDLVCGNAGARQRLELKRDYEGRLKRQYETITELREDLARKNAALSATWKVQKRGPDGKFLPR